MKINITGETCIHGESEPVSLQEYKVFAGMNAGICYGEHGYYGTAVTDPEKAFKRFENVIKSGHHSIADTVRITVLLSDVPKIVAMVLNSLGDYSTCEKSGRYTKMEGSSGRELELYEKWVGILYEDVIPKLGLNIDDKSCKKLAMENARYMLSVFTSTTMSYTASLRQFNYIIDWCDRFALDRSIEDNYFNNKLKVALKELGDWLRHYFYIEDLRDFKNRNFGFLAYQTKNSWSDFTPQDVSYKNTYQTMYKGSFVELAQLQRHKTLDHYMLFKGKSEEYFSPFSIRDTKYEDMWQKDIASVADIVPQGTLVNIVETGTVENFFLKLTERLCGRAQIEICKQTALVLTEMNEHNEFTKDLKNKLNLFIDSDNKIKTKCEILGGCKEGCIHGPSGALTRVI